MGMEFGAAFSNARFSFLATSSSIFAGTRCNRAVRRGVNAAKGLLDVCIDHFGTLASLRFLMPGRFNVAGSKFCLSLKHAGQPI